jgi:CubicO group peptidase (beta-lactamase class C family)
MSERISTSAFFTVMLLAAAACGGGDSSTDADADVPSDSSSDVDGISEAGDDDGLADEADAEGEGDVDVPPPIPGCDDPRFVPYVAALEADMARSGVPGVAVAVVEGTEVTFACGLGVTRPDAEGVPVQTTTLFRIGSITKTLTAIAVLQLVEEGLVRLAARVTDYVPGFHYDREPLWASSFTLEQLLTHTAGQFGDWLTDAPPEEQTEEALVEYFTTGRYPGLGYLMAAPGTLWNYSNTGFMVLGLVAETVRGEHYRALIHDRILEPLGMARTVFLPAEVLADGDFAWGKTNPAGWVEGDGITVSPVPPAAYENAWARPAGYAWSSVLDLTRLLLFLAHGDERVLGEEQRTAMVTSQVPTHAVVTGGGEDIEWSGYGPITDSGIRLEDGWRRMRSFAKNGSLPGYVARMRYFPDQEFGYIHLMNADAGDFQPSFKVLFDLLTDLPPVWNPGLEVDPARLPAYAGTYFDPFLLGEIRVSYSVGTGLTIELPQLDAAGISYSPALTPGLPDHFTMIVDWHALGIDNWNDVTFLPDETGVYRYLYNPVFVATRPPAG